MQTPFTGHAAGLARSLARAVTSSLAVTLQSCLTSLDPARQDVFNALALYLYRRHCDQLPALRRAPLEPEVTDWTLIPPTPLSAFHQHTLYTASEIPVRRFPCNTPLGRRASIYYSSEGLRLMDTGISLSARRGLFPDGRTLPLYSLSPPETLQEGTASYVQARLMRLLGSPGSRFLASEEGIDFGVPLQILRAACSQGQPFALMGDLEALELLFRTLGLEGLHLVAPAGSRLLILDEAPGRVSDEALEALRVLAHKRLRVIRSHVGSMRLYGPCPTPLFEDGLAAATEKRAPRSGYRLPPWVRAQALDPQTLAPLPPETPGMLVLVDLLNLERPAVISTEELGLLTSDGGLRILGTIADAQNTTDFHGRGLEEARA